MQGFVLVIAFSTKAQPKERTPLVRWLVYFILVNIIKSSRKGVDSSRKDSGITGNGMKRGNHFPF